MKFTKQHFLIPFMHISFMQHYLDHVERSRKRLKKIATKFSKPKESAVIIRGTALQEPSIESILGKGRPTYSGTLYPFKPITRAAMLDASFRKSISFGLEHLVKSVKTVSNSFGQSVITNKNFLKFITDESNAESCNRLALLMVHAEGYDLSHWYSQRAESLNSRQSLQFAFVGTEIVPTLMDVDHLGEDLRRKMRDSPHLIRSEYLVELPPSFLSEAAKIAVTRKAIRETEDLSNKALWLNLFGENYTCLRDHGPSIEGFKKPVTEVFNHAIQLKVYRFAIEVEIKMMDLMLDALEKQP